MPKVVSRFACEFDCGRQAVISKRGMGKHEGICWKNPNNKACKTCKFYETYEDDNGMDWPHLVTWRGEYCLSLEGDIKSIKSNCDKWQPVQQ